MSNDNNIFYGAYIGNLNCLRRILVDGCNMICTCDNDDEERKWRLRE